jgi:hypothetical protein
MKIAAMHNVQSGCRVYRLNIFSLVDGRRQAVLFGPSTQQTPGHGEPKMTTNGIYLSFIVFRTCPVTKQSEIMTDK